MGRVEGSDRWRPLFEPRSIAIVGASDQPSLGRTILLSLERLGFAGDIVPINPKYESVSGRRCYHSLEEVPEAPDAAAICVGASRVLAAVQSCARRGVGAGAIFDGGFGEVGDDGVRLEKQISAICREAGIALVGPNCMGVLNPHHRSSLYIQELVHPRGLAGNVGLVSQSGSICIGLITDVRRFGYSHVISSGNEAVLVMADYIDALVDDPKTSVIALFIESVREPDRFVAALDRAAASNKPVIVLKVGRSARAQKAIVSHTGGLAGSARVFSEILRAHRAIETFDMDEFTEVIAACQATHWPKGRRTFVVTGSGGQAELILDVAAQVGLELPPMPAAERAKVESVIGRITGDGNPLDAWGNGDFNTNLPHALKVLNESDVCDNIVLCSDNHEGQPLGPEPRVLNSMKHLVAAAGTSTKPHYALGTRPGLGMHSVIQYLRDSGMNYLGGTRQGLGAIDRLARWSCPMPALRPIIQARKEGVLSSSLELRPSINEYASKTILRAYGLPVTREVLVQTLEAARVAADDIGYPVVIKGISDFVPHKSDFGLVVAGIEDRTQLDDAWSHLGERLRAVEHKGPSTGVLVQEMVSGGVEVFAGVKRDPDFGLVLAFGLGGTAIDLLQDVSLRTLPLRRDEAATMISETHAGAVLKGLRGAAPSDTDELVSCLERFADYAWVDRKHIAEIDLNPIKVLAKGSGCRIVDALIVPAGVGV